MRLVLVSAFLLIPAAVQAETVERYQLERTENGYVRLDTETGAMSTCTEEGEQLVCRAAADDREALEDETPENEIGRLRSELERLDARVTVLERRPAASLPSDQDIDKTLGIMEHLFRGFAGIVKNLDDEPRAGGGDHAEPNPNRT